MDPESILHYRIERKLGEGGMGAVFLATDTRLDRKVAIKCLSPDKARDPESRQRFIHEAKAEAMLSHPNIVTFHEVGEAEDHAFIVMEYVEGQALPEFVQTEGPSLAHILDLVIQVGEGLQAAHEKGVVHRDIKPDNIMVTPKGHVKITDFGLARWKGATTITKTGTRLGTASYMSPEQAEGRRLDYRSDIFSLGVVLYELLCKQRPFDGDSEPVVLYEILNTQPQPLARFCRDAPEDLERIVRKCLAKNPDERYQSAADLVADLRVLRQGSAVATSRAPQRSRRPLVISASAVVVIVALLLVFKPWHIVVEPTKEAFARENRLAVMYFDNLVDPADSGQLGEIAANLVMSDLSASSYLQVVSSQRLYDVLKLLGKESVKRVDRETATQVAEKTEARWMITGSILRLEPSIILSAQLVDVRSGSIVASPKITGTPGQDIFSIVDTLTRQTKEHLSLPAAARAEEDYAVAELTTTSAEAYRHYLRGWDLLYQRQSTRAADEFDKAVQADTTFALAYYGLSFVATGRADIEKEMIAKARSLMHNLSESDRLRILAREASLNDEDHDAIAHLQRIIAKNPDDKHALTQLGYEYYSLWNSRDAIPLFLKTVEIDPLFKEGYNMLCGCYATVGEMDKAIWAANKYVDLAPDEPNSYDSRAELYAKMGQLDDAMASYEKALKIDSQFMGSLDGMVFIHTYKGDYEAAENMLQRKLEDPDRDQRSEGRRIRVYISLFQGRLDEALHRAQHAVETDILEYGNDQPAWWSFDILTALYVRLLELTAEPYWRDSLRLYVDRTTTPILQSTASSRFARARTYAQRVVYESMLGDRISTDSNLSRMCGLLDTSRQMMERDLYGSVVSRVKFNRGEYDSAIYYWMSVALYESEFTQNVRIGRLHLLAGHVAEAVDFLERAATQFDRSRFWDATDAVRLHYWLGLAYEQSGWRDKAIEQYETFVEIWKDADQGIIDLEDARERLSRLKAQVG